MRRGILIFVVTAVVAAISMASATGVGPSRGIESPRDIGPVAVIGSGAATVADLAATSTVVDGGDVAQRPCIAEPDCAGGVFLVVAAALPLLVLVARVPRPFGRLPVRPRRLRSALLAQGPDHPPRPLL